LSDPLHVSEVNRRPGKDRDIKARMIARHNMHTRLIMRRRKFARMLKRANV
jgi:hypothetical protein